MSGFHSNCLYLDAITFIGGEQAKQLQELESIVQSSGPCIDSEQVFRRSISCGDPLSLVYNFINAVTSYV